MTVASTTSTTGSPSRQLSRGGRVLRGAAGVAILALAGELLGRAGLVQREDLPPTSTVVARAAGLLGDREFLIGVQHTLIAWVGGLLIAFLLAVPLGVLLGSVPVVNTATRAIVEFLRPIPSVALIPLAGLLLGSGYTMEIPLIVYASVWPVLYNTVYALQDVDPIAKETLRTFGFGRLAVLWRVSLPSSAPFIATGVRLSAAVALILAVGTEILSGFGDGIGTFIAQAGNVPGNVDDVLAGTLWTGVLGLAANSLLLRAERRLFRWHHRLGDRP